MSIKKIILTIILSFIIYPVSAEENLKSIGKFIESINATPFFGKSLILDEQETLENKTKTGTSRLEKFEIKGDVQTYEPFGRDM